MPSGNDRSSVFRVTYRLVALGLGIASLAVLSACSSGAANGSSSSPPATSTEATTTTSPSASPIQMQPFGDAINTPDTSPELYTAKMLPIGSSSTAVFGLDKSGSSFLEVLDESGAIQNVRDLDPASYPPSCGAWPSVVGGKDAVSLLRFDTVLASGINAANYSVVLDTFDESLQTVSSVTVASSVVGEPTCVSASSSMGYDVGELPTGLQLNEWIVGGASADRSWIGVATGLPLNGASPYLVNPDLRQVKKAHARGFRIIGNSIHHECKGNTNDVSEMCAGLWTNPEGRIVYKDELQLNSPILTSGYCDISDANCSYVATGMSNGEIVLSGDNGVKNPDYPGVVDPFTSKVKYYLRDLSNAGSAAFQQAHNVLAVSGAGTNDDSGKASVVGYDASGRKLWNVHADKVCGSTNQGFVVVANNQIALLDPTTGKQLAASANVTSCPSLSADGIGAAAMPDGLIALVSLRI